MNPIVQKLDDAIAAHEQQDFVQAAELYLELLKDNPKHPDANHNLGVLSVQTGKTQEGLLFFETAINSNPTVSTYWLSLINVLINLNEITEAKNILKQAYSLGHRSKVFEKFEKALTQNKFNENVEIAQSILANLYELIKKRKFKEFQSKCRKYSKRYPNSIKLKEAQACAFEAMGKWDLIRKKLQEILLINPGSLDHLLQLGSINLKMKDFDQAIIAFLSALKIQPNNPTVNYNLGVAYAAVHEFEKSISFYNKSHLLDPNNVEVQINLGNMYAEIGQVELAINTLRNAVELAPKKFEANFNLGHHLSVFGKYEEAKIFFLRALEICPDNSLTHHALSSLINYSMGSKHLKQMEKIIATKNITKENAAILNFSIAKAYDQLGSNEQAYKHYTEANELQNEISDYCPDEENQFFGALKDLGFTIKSQEKLNVSNTYNLVPIFIVGMPRSGTSLIEQILTAHSKISGAGELKTLSNFGNLIIEGKLNTSRRQLNLFRETYLKEICKYSDDKAKFITDKLPHNFRYIPLIKLIFPESKIIHIKRDPSATCWSNFARYFNNGSLKYSYNLDNVVDHYLMYEDLMDTWSRNFVDAYYTVTYEELVCNYEIEISSLLKYLGINVEPNCFEPHKNKRLVKTSSNKQVRKKIYTGSSETWRKFEPFLNGAFNRLTS